MGTRPPRWLKCPRKSAIIHDKFIAFKTFLDDKFSSQVSIEDMFQFPMLHSYVQGNKRELGMIIDLTNTKRFYDSSVIDKAGIGYCKLALRGHGETPSPDQIGMFIRICTNYFEKNPGKIIGVHCTHGFNRTGFLIVAFLCEVEEWSVEAAVDYFAKCRPPGIYKGHYIADLFQRYGNPAEAPSAPELPDWCFEEEDGVSDDDGDMNRGSMDGEEEKPMKRRRRRTYNENAKFAENITSLETVSARGAEKIQEIAENMLQWDRGTFPGSQPVSMDRKNIELLHHKPYRVTWKADGTRYLMLILKEGEVYFLDRDNSVFTSEKFTFPRRKFPDQHIFDTLVDGELVMDKVGNELRPRFLIYDIVKFEGQDVGHTDLDRRMLCVEKEIIKPRDEAAQAGKLDKTSEPFSIRKKDFWPVEQSSWVLDKFMPKVTHETDGLILQPLLDPYVPGQCPVVMKWKPHDLNSVDFLLNIVTVKQVGTRNRYLKKGTKCVETMHQYLVFSEKKELPKKADVKIQAQIKHTYLYFMDIGIVGILELHVLNIQLAFAVERLFLTYNLWRSTGKGYYPKTLTSKFSCLPEKVGRLFVQGYDQPFSTIKENGTLQNIDVENQVTAELKHYDKRIIECTWDNKAWKFLRLREDKSFPNALKTAQSVCESIKHPVTKENLLDYINRYGYVKHGGHPSHSK